MDNNEANAPQPIKHTHSFKKWVLGTLMLLLLALTGGLYWLVFKPSGLNWLLAAATRVTEGALTYSGVTGSLNSFNARSIAFRDDKLFLRVEDLTFRWQPQSLLTGSLTIGILNARSIELHRASTEETGEESLGMPESLQLPVKIAIDLLGIQSLKMFTLGNGDPDIILTNLALRLESDGKLHYLRTFSLEHEFGKIAGNLLIGATPPFELASRLVFHGWAVASSQDRSLSFAALRLEGNLAEIDAALAVKDGKLDGQGRLGLRPFDEMPLSGLTFRLTGLNPNLFSSDLPKASLSLRTHLEKAQTDALQGRFLVDNASAHPWDKNGLPLSEISAQLSLTNELIQLDDLLIRFSPRDKAKGMLTGKLAWQISTQSGSADIQVHQLNPARLDTSLRSANLSGKLSFTGDQHSQQGQITLHDKAQRLSLETAFSHSAAAITVDKLKLAHGESSLSGHGSLHLDNSQPFTFEGLLKQFDVSAFIEAPRSDLNARLKLAGQLFPQPVAMMDFSIQPSHFANQPITGQGKLALDYPQRIQSDTRLRLGDNQLELKGRLGQANDRLHLSVTAPQLTQLGADLQGNLDARITLSGTFDRLGVAFEASSNHLNYRDEHRISHLKAQGSLQGTAIGLDLQTGSYRMGTETYLQNLSLTLTGTQAQHRLSLKSDIDQATQASFQASGGLITAANDKRPFQWRGTIEKLALTGTLPLELTTQPTLQISPEQVMLGHARIRVANGQVDVHDMHWTPKRWSTQGVLASITLPLNGTPTGDSEPLRLGGNWQLSAAGPQLTGQIRIQRERGDLALPLATPFALGLQTLALNLLAEGNTLSGQLHISGKHLGETHAQVKVSLQPTDTAWRIDNNAALGGNLRFDLPDLAWIGPALDSNLRSGGQLAARVALSGTIEQPELLGNLFGEALTFTLLDEGIHLEEGKLAIRLDQDMLHVDTLTFNAPHEKRSKDRLLRNLKLARQSGELTVRGSLNFRTQQSALTIETDHLPLIQQPDRWIIVSGKGLIDLNDRALDIKGNIVADVGFLKQPEKGIPELPDDVIIIGQEKSEPKPPAYQVNLDATLNLGEQFFLRASGLDARLAGQLRLRSRPEQTLSAVGSIATQDARFDAYGQQMLVRRGIVNFDGPLDNPGLNILAVRSTLPPGVQNEFSRMIDHQPHRDPALTALGKRSTGSQVEAGVEVTGTVRQPKITLVSRPEVPDSEKLSWIVLGRAPEAGGLDSALLLSAARAILGGQSDESAIDNISRGLGFDEFSIRQREGDNSPANQVGVIGKRLSSRAYLSYERGLTTARTGIARLTYTLFPNVTIVTGAGEDSSVDLFYNILFD